MVTSTKSLLVQLLGHLNYDGDIFYNVLYYLVLFYCACLNNHLMLQYAINHCLID